MQKENKNKITKEGMIVILIMIAAIIGMYVYPEENKNILIIAIIATFVVGFFCPASYKEDNSGIVVGTIIRTTIKKDK